MSRLMVIVDDLKINREILKSIFKSDFDILEAETGEEALEIIEEYQNEIDMVLLDLMLPGISGLDVLARRRELEQLQFVPVVVITGSEQLEDQVKAFELGASDYISKPFEPEVVSSRIQNIITSNQRMQDAKLEARKMKIRSEIDEMTGLYNKATTEKVMERILQDSENRLQAMLVFDIDNFKTVNDTLGHRTGDHVIQTIANLISSSFRKTDIVGRIGGDEFCALMVDIPHIGVAYRKINELLVLMKYKPNLSIPEYVTLSIGLADNQEKHTSYAELFSQADSALYAAKHYGKAQYQEYGNRQISVEEDERPVAVLLTSNRSVGSLIHASIPGYIRVVEVSKIDALDKISETDIRKVKLCYIDISDRQEDLEAYWKQIEAVEWIVMQNVFAICEEGSVAQYKSALDHKAADLFLAPLEQETVKRRTIKKLEQ